MTLLKVLVVMITAWIGTVWPGAWTALILLVSASVLCLSLAMDHARTTASKTAKGSATA